MFYTCVVFFGFVLLVESAARRGSKTLDYFKEQENEVIRSDGLICPKEYHRLPIFANKCDVDDDCKGPEELCCREKTWKICRQGISKRKKEPKHARKKINRTNVNPAVPVKLSPHHFAFFPGIPRMCPTREAVVEVLPVQTCSSDKDCAPRICCPDGPYNYCRTAVPKLGATFYPRIMKSFKAMMSYLQCSSPPPPLLDFFPKPCKNSLDCLPNLCCQEKGRKVCRPPKRSLLTSFSLPIPSYA